MYFAKLPIRALSPGSIWATNASAACSSSSKLAFMLPLRSSSMIRVIGWTSLANRVSGCGLPLSSIVKSSRVRSGTSRPRAPVTVA